ncbi:hypothetical protein, partial [Elioraea rosea]|uniref:hypothetical protein n=1 Tax=Elioraea rosea TaxID=2492390 RepID=UPI00195187BB
AAALAAATPRSGQPPRQPGPVSGDWLRGGTEPEGVFGPRRFTVPGRTLAMDATRPSVRPGTALRDRTE